MPKIEIRHSCIVIHNYTPGDNAFIESRFSIYDKVYHRRFPKGMYYDEKNKDLYLPSGMDFYYITKSFGNDVFHKTEPNDFEGTNRILLKYAPRDQVQMEAINFCIGHDKYERNRNAAQLAVNLNTGKGKTYVAVAVMAYFCVKTIMITSSIDWINQWREKIKEYTNIQDDEIYTIAGKASIIKLLKFNLNKRIKFYLCSHDTIKAFATKYGWENVTKLFKALKIGIKIYDEAHLYFDNICMIDFYTDIWKTFYLTASPMRSDRYEDSIYQFSFKTIPKINLYDEETDPHTKYLAIRFNSRPTPEQVSLCRNAYGFDRIKYTDYLITRPNYYLLLSMLMDMIFKFTSPNGKCLIYIGTNKAISVTHQWLNFYYPGVSIGLFSSLVPKLEKKNQLNNKIILTTTKSAGAALDIDGLEMTIILNEPFKSKVLAQQTLGRTRGQNTLYVDIIDIGFRSICYYYNAKKPVFRKYATECDETEFDDGVLENEYNLKLEKEKKELEEYKESLRKEGKLKQIIEIVDKKE